MRVDRTFYCSAPDCDGNVTTASDHPQTGIFVRDFYPGGENSFYFCHWDCVLKFAGSLEPVEVIPFHEEEPS